MAGITTRRAASILTLTIVAALTLAAGRKAPAKAGRLTDLRTGDRFHFSIRTVPKLGQAPEKEAGSRSEEEVEIEEVSLGPHVLRRSNGFISVD